MTLIPGPGNSAGRGERSRTAVVGGGVAGIASAWLLQDAHQVTLFEAASYLGGHTHTIVIEGGPDEGTPVDTGFIVFNDRTYPLFCDFLNRLKVQTRTTTMSFSFHDQVSGLTYSGSGANGLFAQRSNLLRPSFWRMLGGIGRFFRDAREALERGGVPRISLGEYLEGRYPPETIDNYIIPMASAIWSSAPGAVRRFPVESFLRFFHNHGLLGLRDRPRWMTVKGGSHAYVRAFLDSFRGEVRLGSPVTGILRRPDGVTIETADGRCEPFDRVVVATHADDALGLLERPTAAEQRLLGTWRYHTNQTVLHTDTSVLPPVSRAWSCWNYCREGTGDQELPVSVSYSMNLLQGLATRNHYCVSLNRRTPPRENSVIARMVYRHPAYTHESVDTQKELSGLNGHLNTWYCGSYFGHGFHEDAVRSAVQVGRSLGVSL